MSGGDAARAAEVAGKLALLREALGEAGAIRLRGADWFAWVTGGGSNTLVPGAETGAADLLVTREEACVLADAVEAARLRDDALPAGFTYHIAPWAEPELHERYVLAAAGERALLSDRPQGTELALPASLRQRRLVLGEAEQERYRALGLAGAQAASAVMRQARPGWSERQLAGAAACALVERGIEPALVLAVGERRLPLLRQAGASAEPLGGRALLMLAGRRHGLYASLARMVTFGAAPPEQHELLAVEATGLDAAIPGNSLSAVYHALAQGYRHAGRDAGIDAHHQGGITGYQAREILATPSSATALEPGMACAFNPGFAGLAVQDTFLLGHAGLENLTFDPEWPATSVQGRMRPLWLEATW